MKNINDTVIKNGFCIGCGVCSALAPDRYITEMDEYGLYKSHSIDSIDSIQNKIILKNKKIEELACPFSENAANETQLADYFLGDAPHNHEIVGRYTNLYAGWVGDQSIRDKASSGGIARWIGLKLKEKGLVDGVIQVCSNEVTAESGGALFEYRVCETKDEIIRAATSAYYPVTLDKVLKQIKGSNKKYLFVGLPCFVKSIRLMALQNAEEISSIAYTLSIFCGHLKSAAYAEMIAWQIGYTPEKIKSINFRGKTEGIKASIKRYEVTGPDGVKSELSSKLFGTNYGLGFFKPLACDFCDDVFGETADVVIGDAWLPKYVKDHKGTSLVISRNPEIDALIAEASEQEVLFMDKLTPSQVIQSQAGSYRHRTDGLRWRLWKYSAEYEWVPVKRIKKNLRALFVRRKKIYTMRYKISSISHEMFLNAKRRESLEYFYKRMRPLANEYKYKMRFEWKTIQAAIGRKIKKMIRA